MIDFALPPFEFPKPAIIRPAPAELLRYGGDPVAVAIEERHRRQGLVAGAPKATAKKKVPPPTYVPLTAWSINIGDNASFNLTSANLGTAAPDRVLILAVGCRGSSGNNRTLNGASISGSNFTIDAAPGLTPMPTMVARLAYPTGTSATITVTASGRVNRAGAKLYAVYGLSDTSPVDFDASNGTAVTSTSLGVDVSAGGIAFFAAASASTGAMSWTGVTEDEDDTGGSVHRFSAASLQASSAMSPLTGGVTFGGSGTHSICAASYR